MLDNSQLRSEFYNSGFNSFYSCELLAKHQGYLFSGEDNEFNTIIENIKDNPAGRYSYPCFGRFQNTVRQSGIIKDAANLETSILTKDIKLFIVINTDKTLCRRYCQYCWMTVEELINHINIVKSLFDGFEFSVLKDSKNKFMKVKFLFKQEQITLFKIRFLLTWMRYSYEWAISMATLDAYRILNNPEYLPELSKENIFNLVQITNKLVWPYVLGDQIICRYGVPMPFNEFKRNILRETNRSLNEDIYIRPHRVSKLGDFIHFSSDETDYSRFPSTGWKEFSSIAWWEDSDAFIQVRLPLYRQILDTFKKLQYYEPTK